MKKVFLLALLIGLSLSTHAQTAGTQGAPESGVQRVTLYGPLARGHDFSRANFSFRTGKLGRDGDLDYGSLYVSEEHDWFQVSTAKGVRTAFRDLGKHDWTDSFSVPVVEPFPVLKEGEQRHVTVDASGRDGEDGAPGAQGAEGEDGAPGVDGGGVTRPPLPVTGAARGPESLSEPRPPRRPKHDGVPKVDPVFVKAVPGHMYVIRVVDADEDFYVLFRIESLVRGDNCTITWKRVPPPAQSASASK
jgi:hypothetical protein